jgi:hypothetical protein
MSVDEGALSTKRLAMPLQFHRAVENMEIWSATSEGYSFVISHESPTGPGFHGHAGYLASWRRVYEGRHAIRITGSPFKTFGEAEAAFASSHGARIHTRVLRKRTSRLTPHDVRSERPLSEIKKPRTVPGL